MKDKVIRRYLIMMIAFGIIIVFLLACAIYMGNYYHAEDAAFDAISSPVQTVSVTEDEKTSITFTPNKPTTTGMIFYPGGKVEYESYAPLMEKLASKGILCVLVHMPGNLAILDVDAADDIFEQYPDIQNWYIAGHSLGGYAAASYAADHDDRLSGLIMLAAYSGKDLSSTSLTTLSIYGSEDGVLNLKKYKENKSLLPAASKEIIISGANHAYFGCYGEQKGDGAASISNEEQMNLTAEYISDFILSRLARESCAPDSGLLQQTNSCPNPCSSSRSV
ncbi:alpha/beta hydrolase [Eubacterium oxidoreducens]|uniref:Alpha/beta hydrolase family protein n=1 Tax=Eubacterium oxidoreducens TaxID=1732 RepID=A0A1G6A6A0_EUBOX|nr:alpha/beta hydrolase [Eubacterium oxidoreducens]SDB03830.1 Alpha/beta hydrolase family protein [Eubacterium oxidoreducens]